MEHLSAFYGAQHVWFCPTADLDLRGWVPFHYMGRGPLLLCGAGSPFYSAGLGPLSITGAGSPFKQWGWVPFYSMRLSPRSISGAGSPSIIWSWIPVLFCEVGSPFKQWGCVPFQAMGLGPLLLYGAGSPFTVWGWVPLQSIEGRIYCRYLAPWSTRLPSLAHNMCGTLLLWGGWIPLLFCGARSTCHQWGWVPFQAIGLGPLLLYGAGSPFNQWGWVPCYYVGLAPFYSVGLGPLSFCGTEYHRWWCRGVAMLCRVHPYPRGGISLGIIQSVPTRWVFGTFPRFSELLVQCAKISSRWGGVCVYFLKSVRKGRFRNVWVAGGGR